MCCNFSSHYLQFICPFLCHLHPDPWLPYWIGKLSAVPLGWEEQKESINNICRGDAREFNCFNWWSVSVRKFFFILNPFPAFMSPVSTSPAMQYSGLSVQSSLGWMFLDLLAELHTTTWCQIIFHCIIGWTYLLNFFECLVNLGFISSALYFSVGHSWEKYSFEEWKTVFGKADVSFALKSIGQGFHPKAFFMGMDIASSITAVLE